MTQYEKCELLFGTNNVRNTLVANRSVFKLFLTELNPTILKIFRVTDGLTDELQELLELLFATNNENFLVEV